MNRKSEKRIVDVYAYMPIMCELLAQGKEVSLVITGNSMSPFIVHGRDEILIAPPKGEWNKGDMAFFRRENGQYVMHRICKVDKSGDCYFIGDAQQFVEGPIKSEQIFGKIISVKRKGKWIGPGDFWWEFFEHIWLNMVPLRPLCRKFYTLLLWFFNRKCVRL